jgi:hypothetical protein
MQSYHISVLVLSLPDITSDWPFEIKYFFAAALESIEDHLYHPDGGQGAGPVDEYLDRGTRQEVKKRLSGTLQGADAAYKANHQEAIRLYRIIFGNDFPAYG